MRSAGDWIGLAGLVVGVVGLAVAFVQIVALGRRTTAVENAVDAEKARIAGAMLMSASAGMQLIEKQLLQAVEANDAGKARAALHDWRRAAVDAQSYVGTAGSEELAEALELSLGMLDYALTDIGSHGPGAVAITLLPKISASCRLIQSHANAMMIGD